MRMRSPSSAPPPRRRVGSTASDRDAELVLGVEAQPADEFVGERRLPRAAGAGDAEGWAEARAGARRTASSASSPAGRVPRLDGGDAPGPAPRGRLRAGR